MRNPGSVAEQLKAGHKNTEGLEKKVCGIAEQVKTRGRAGPSLSDLLGSPKREPAGPVGGFDRFR